MQVSDPCDQAPTCWFCAWYLSLAIFLMGINPTPTFIYVALYLYQANKHIVHKYLNWRSTWRSVLLHWLLLVPSVQQLATVRLKQLLGILFRIPNPKKMMQTPLKMIQSIEQYEFFYWSIAAYFLRACVSVNVKRNLKTWAWRNTWTVVGTSRTRNHMS